MQIPYLSAWSDSDNLPFEARAYEGIFSTVIAIQTEVRHELTSLSV